VGLELSANFQVCKSTGDKINGESVPLVSFSCVMLSIPGFYIACLSPPACCPSCHVRDIILFSS
jgi:hypothetical protein